MNGTDVYCLLHALESHSKEENSSDLQVDRQIDEYLAEMPAGNLTDIRFDLAMLDQQGCVDILENVLAG